jgi:hypothetical protein
MTEKLNQMDIALSTTLEVLDTSNKCHLALIFGDHGMTEDGCVSSACHYPFADYCLSSVCDVTRIENIGIMVEEPITR